MAAHGTTDKAKYKEAIDICKLALKYGLADTTKNGYAGRIEKLQKNRGTVQRG